MAEKSKNREKIREKNLIPFVKGKSGNPKGRPFGQRNYATIYKEALIKLAKLNDKSPEELEEEIVSAGLLNARKGNYPFYKDVLDRIHGQATQKKEVEHSGEVTFLTDEQRKNILKRESRRLGLAD